jgi:hypothetical protein
VPTLSGFDSLSGFSRTEQPIREEKMVWLVSKLTFGHVVADRAFSHCVSCALGVDLSI